MARRRKRQQPALASPEAARLRESLAQQELSAELLVERIAALELALEDEGWRRLTQQAEVEFSREGLGEIALLSRIMYLKNPLLNRAVSIQAAYVWALGVNVSARHPAVNKVIQDFLDDPKNKAELGHQGRMENETELQTDGNLFFVLFTQPRTGRVKVRSIPFAEIAEVISNPDDRKDPWYYKRVWSRQALSEAGTVVPKAETAYYPAAGYRPKDRPSSLAGHPIQWDAPVLHLKVGGFSDWSFGLSEVYSAIDWAKAYKEFLEDWATLSRAYSRWAHKVTTPGGKRAVAAAKAKLGTTYGTSGASAESNPPPTVGSVFVADDKVKLDPIRIGGANVSADDGRRIMLMVAAATGWPETFFGDVSVGTLATATSLDRPTELRIKNRQILWADFWRLIFGYVILCAVRAPQGALRSLGAVVVEDGEERIEWGEDPETAKPIAPDVSVDFPPIVERDIATTVNAIVSAATLNGGAKAGTLDDRTISRLLLVALGESDVDAALDRILPDEGAPSPPEGAPQPGSALGEAAGGRYSDIDFAPPETVQANARRALEVRAQKPESERGMTEVGLARARDLSNGRGLSPETVRRMLAYFERHEADKKGATWDEQGAGWQAWMGWGGDEGWAWARKVAGQMDAADKSLNESLRDLRQTLRTFKERHFAIRG